jgi:hypothetical protein
MVKIWEITIHLFIQEDIPCPEAGRRIEIYEESIAKINSG